MLRNIRVVVVVTVTMTVCDIVWVRASKLSFSEFPLFSHSICFSVAYTFLIVPQWTFIFGFGMLRTKHDCYCSI
jgi:hypothetical protein